MLTGLHLLVIGIPQCAPVHFCRYGSWNYFRVDWSNCRGVCRRQPRPRLRGCSVAQRLNAPELFAAIMLLAGLEYLLFFFIHLAERLLIP